MCDHCERGKRVETEIDDAGYLLVYEADPEYHMDAWIIDVCDADDNWASYSFKVPYCPMCGTGFKNRRVAELESLVQDMLPFVMADGAYERFEERMDKLGIGGA